MRTTTPTTYDDAFRARVDALFGDDFSADLRRVGLVLGKSPKAIRDSLAAGTLPLRIVRTGGRTAAIRIVVDDLYAHLGLEPRPITTGDGNHAANEVVQ